MYIQWEWYVNSLLFVCIIWHAWQVSSSTSEMDFVVLFLRQTYPHARSHHSEILPGISGVTLSALSRLFFFFVTSNGLSCQFMWCWQITTINCFYSNCMTGIYSWSQQAWEGRCKGLCKVLQGCRHFGRSCHASEWHLPWGDSSTCRCFQYQQQPQGR